MASSYSHVSEIRHEVFISFRGKDVRRGLLSYLVKELHRGQVDAYVDNRLERGVEISSSLVSAIEGSQILLVIFSKNYASSKWCLEELAKIVDCMERNKQILIPVFYNVDPSDLRYQKGDYGAAFTKHEEDFKEDMVKVQNWRCALEKVSQLAGFHYPSNFENESDFVEEIVEDVSSKLSKFCSSDSNDPSESNGLVGIDENTAWIKSLLANESKEVLMLGIWGMGGIGKTTIAHVVFDTFSPQYEGCFFLENVREELEKHQLSYLREKLVSRLLEEKKPRKNGTDKAKSPAKRKLSMKKLLIVLDDVNTPKLLKDFLDPICFGPGSTVIVTSRDKQVFTAGGFHEIHMVKELNFEESLKLFCINAFNENQPKMGYEELSKKAVAIANGIPLALIVFGSYFNSKSEEIWECALEKFKKYPDGEIQRVLRLSYDALDDIEREVFLDIAFFFKEDNKDYVIRQLDSWGFHGACGIEALKDKALITISKDNRIQMHDLIQEMGWEIVRQESKDPGKRSRLRDAEEVYAVLKNNNRGANLVEGMVLDVSQIGDVALIVDSLKRMPKLRLLKLHSSMQDIVNVKGSGLDIRKQFAELQKLSKLLIYNRSDGVLVLERRNTSESKPLMPLPNLNIGSALKELASLGSEVHIKSLHHLFMNGCSSLSKDISLNSTSIGLLCYLECSDTEGENVGPEESAVMLPNEMRQLNFTVTRMELLNSSTGHFSSLECSENTEYGLQLESLPKEFPVLRSTYYHRLSNCREPDFGKPKLLVLFDGFRYYSEQYNWMGGLTNLVELDFVGTNVERLPLCIKHLLGLKKLSLRGCCSLRSISELPPSIEELYADKCMLLETIELSSNTARALEQLKILSLRGCSILRSISELPPSLRTLYADDCVLLETVAFSSSNTAGSLEQNYLDISLQNCTSLDTKKLESSCLQYARAQVHGYRIRRENRRLVRVCVCYPASKVPEWFTYCALGASMTMELVPPSGDLFDYLLCAVLSPSSYPFSVQVECQSYCEDGNMLLRDASKNSVILHEFQHDLNSDHVCMWYLDSHALEDIKEGIVKEQCALTSSVPKFTFQFSCEVRSGSDISEQELNGLIKECGVYPLYLTSCHSLHHEDVFDLETTGIGNGVGSSGVQ